MWEDWLHRFFAILFVAYLLETVASQWYSRKRKAPLLGAVRLLVQVPLFVLAVIVAWKLDLLDRRLFSLFEILPALAAGHFIFTASVWFTHRSWRDAREIFLNSPSLIEFFVTNPVLAFRTLHLSFTEEIIYRAALQSLLLLWLGPVPGIAIAAVLFALSHDHVFRNTWRETIEFVTFSLLLGALYYATSSLAAVVIIHAVRNFEIAMLEFSLRVHELQDEAEAQRELDQRYRQESIIPS